MNINKLIEGQREGERMQKMIDDRAFTFISNDSKTSVVYEVHCKEIIKKHTKYFLIKFLDSEIERLEKDKARVNGLTLRGELEHGYILFMEDQIAHFQDIKKQLE